MPALPEHLRTDHWFCDVHHAMLIIMFERLVPALEEENERLAGYFVDNLTMYWLQHCIMEEEGFAHAIQSGRLTLDMAQAHAEAHETLMRSWRESVYDPFKAGTDRQTLAGSARAYFDSVVHHIETVDQRTYGTESDYDDRARSAEIAHIARTRLPLSPFMAGATDLAAVVVPDMARTFAAGSLGVDAAKPLSAPTLLPDGPRGGLRAALRAAAGRTRPVAA